MRSDLVTAFVECNGNLGGMASADKLDGTLGKQQLWQAGPQKDVEGIHRERSSRMDVQRRDRW